MLVTKGSARGPGEVFVGVGEGRRHHQGRLLRRGCVQAGLKKWTGFHQAETGYAAVSAGGPGSRLKKGGLQGSLREL